LLARSLKRGREVTIRAALGASRGRLIRQFLLEGLVLAGTGGIAGLLMTTWMVRVLVACLPSRNPIFDQARIDARVMIFPLVLSVVSALLFALIPAIKASVWAPGPSLTARTVIGSGNRWRHILMAIEAMLCVFLLSGAGLVGQNL